MQNTRKVMSQFQEKFWTDRWMDTPHFILTLPDMTRVSKKQKLNSDKP